MSENPMRGAGLLAGMVSIITGAAGGIGGVTARAFAREGARLVLTDMNAEKGRKLAAELAGSGVEATFITADIRQASDCDAVVAHAKATFGRLDIAFNNAGHIGVLSPFHTYPKAELANTIDINILGTWNCMRAQIEAMLEAGGGVVCNNCSVAGLVGSPSAAAYVMTKHAVAGLSKAAALDYAAAGIRVNAICAGAIDTDMPRRLTQDDPALLEQLRGLNPMKRFGRPEEVAELVTFLCSARASFITGAMYAIDGGWTTQ